VGQNVTKGRGIEPLRKSLLERRFENAVVLGARDCRLAEKAVLCAVSGGPDSVALLLALSRRASAIGIRKLGVAHVNHRLRLTSGKDAALVRNLSRSLGLRCETVSVNVDATAAGLEAGARVARYFALEELARRSGYDTVVTGHTRTDQAETVLLRLLRGSGLRGLSAMARVRGLGPGVKLARPLLGLSGADTRRYVKAAGARVALDSTNADTTLRRNALRLRVWPALARLEPALELRLAELAGQAREDEAALEALARAATSSLVRRRGQRLAIPAPALAALPPAVGRRVLRRALYRLNPLAQPSAPHLRALLALASRGRGEVHVSGSLTGRVVRGKLWLGRREPTS